MNKINLNCDSLHASNNISDKITNTAKQCLNNLYDKLDREYDEEFNRVPLYRDKRFSIVYIATALSVCRGK